MAVGHLERAGVADIDLFLARAPFALRILDRDAGAVEPVADRPHHALFLGGLEDVVVLDVVAGGGRVDVALLADGLVVLVEQIEFQL